MDPVIVVGGGAAGIIAAWRSAGLRAPTLLLEKNERLGIKLHISGGGKCNITHAGRMHDIRMAFEPNEARFLRLPFLRFTNEDVLALLHERGVETYTRPDGRIFPVSGRAEDVAEALAWHAGHAGAEIRCGSVVERLEAADGKVHGIWMQGRSHRASAVILATGGKVISRWRGDLLFTHKGISGPTALGVSRDVALALEHGPATLDADLLPDRPPEDLAAELTSAEHRAARRGVRSLLDAWLPNRIVPAILAQAGVDPTTPLHQLPRPARNRLIETLKGWPLGAVRAVPLERGEVTAGGVSLDEVDPATMASRKVPGLYLCGEILDIAGPVGGYNLQAAFSSGYVAGEATATAVRGLTM